MGGGGAATLHFSFVLLHLHPLVALQLCLSVTSLQGKQRRASKAGFERERWVAEIVIPEALVDKLEGPKYAARRAELRREAEEAAREQGINRRQRRFRTRPRRAMSQRMKQQQDRRENEDESGTTTRWHEGRCENWRETANSDRKR